jgi:hypothetical protein
MASSAKATYFATPEGGNFTYVFLIRNTSAGQFDIYAAMIAAQYEVPLLPGGLQNIVPISSPPGWQLIPSTPPYGFLTGQTSFAGSPVASGYIMPGEVERFVFRSSTPPPETLPFGCCFYNENNEWGFAYDGTAERVDCIPKSEFPRPWAHGFVRRPSFRRYRCRPSRPPCQEPPPGRSVEKMVRRRSTLHTTVSEIS